jgi:electron transport complex protein RnfC
MTAGLLSRLLGRPGSFRHGVHPIQGKDATRGLPIEHLPLLEEYVLPLSQAAGAPPKPIVAAGQTVARGQVIAEPDGWVSVALHAPVAGTVKGIEMRPHPDGGLSPAIVIRTDLYADQTIELLPETPDLLSDAADRHAALERIQLGGVVGMGGAAYPAHAKLAVPQGKYVETVLLNGAECEPYLTSDHRIMVERTREVLRGLRIFMHLTGAQQGRIGIETNKPDAIAAFEALLEGDPSVKVVPLTVKYPEGAKQMMIEAITGLRVPLGGRSVDQHVTIHNVGTSAALADVFDRRLPVLDRVVTVTGPGVRRPTNVRAPIGTPLSALLEHAGGLLPEARQVVVGGAMMGQSQASLDAPVLKGMTGLLAMVDPPRVHEEEPCIRCGRCVDACPMLLDPALLARLTRAGRTEELAAHYVRACFECGSCAFACPSHIPLTNLMRVGKTLVRKAKS